ncbi:MAG: hypothetical protein D6701_12690 [Gemmatimonadetes bacterium]|nr:MAG: hypothetical protein D6701_12690 [Gemmatimonadota bacterium]
MPLQSYLVLPRPGARTRLLETLSDLPGCEAFAADEHDLLILLADTPDADEDRRLRDRLDGLEDVQCLLLAFGEIDPDTPVGDPLADEKRRARGAARALPMLQEEPRS